MTGGQRTPRLALMGFSRGMLGHLEGWTPPGSVLVIEEPDLLGPKRVAPALARHRAEPFVAVIPCLEYAVPAALRSPDDVRDFLTGGLAVLKPAGRQASVGVRILQVPASRGTEAVPGATKAMSRAGGVYLSTFNLGVTAQQVLGLGLLALVVIPAGGWGWLGLALALALLGWAARRLLTSGTGRG